MIDERVETPELSAQILSFVEWYEQENNVRLSEEAALSMIVRCGISTMRGEKAARRLQDKQNRGTLRK